MSQFKNSYGFGVVFSNISRLFSKEKSELSIDFIHVHRTFSWQLDAGKCGPYLWGWSIPLLRYICLFTPYLRCFVQYEDAEVLKLQKSCRYCKLKQQEQPLPMMLLPLKLQARFQLSKNCFKKKNTTRLRHSGSFRIFHSTFLSYSCILKFEIYVLDMLIPKILVNIF